MSGSTLSNALSDRFFGTTFNSDRQRQETMDFNAQQSQMQRDFEERMWQQTNEYNSPSALMQRLRAAGINPAMVMSSGVLSGSQATIPSGSEATMSGGVGFAPQGSLVDLLKLPSEIEKNKAQAENLGARTETEDALRDARLRALSVGADKLQADVKNISSMIEQRVHQNALTDAEKNNISFEQMYKSGKLSIDYGRLQNETKMTDSQIEKNKAEMELALAKAKVTRREYDEMIWTYAVRAAGLSNQVQISDAQINVARATARKLELDADLLEPGAINAQSWARDMSGVNGSFNQVGSNVAYQILSTIKQVGGIVLKK